MTSLRNTVENENGLLVMFGGISNDEADHWHPISMNTTVPPKAKEKSILILVTWLEMEMRSMMPPMMSHIALIC